MAHTPGPWFIEDGENSWDLYAEQKGHPKKIAKCPKQSIEYAEYWPDDDDANLIAAAPELLAALKALVDTPAKDIHKFRVWDKAYQVIAKAEGDA